jgi:hypothetical protein
MGESFLVRKGGGGGALNYFNVAVQSTNGAKFEPITSASSFSFGANNVGFNFWALNNATTKPLLLTNATMFINGSFTNNSPIFNYFNFGQSLPVVVMSAYGNPSTSNPVPVGQNTSFWHIGTSGDPTFISALPFYLNTQYNRGFVRLDQWNYGPSFFQQTTTRTNGYPTGNVGYYNNKIYVPFSNQTAVNHIEVYNLNTPSQAWGFNKFIDLGEPITFVVNGPYMYASFRNSTGSITKLRKYWVENSTFIAETDANTIGLTGSFIHNNNIYAFNGSSNQGFILNEQTMQTVLTLNNYTSPSPFAVDNTFMYYVNFSNNSQIEKKWLSNLETATGQGTFYNGTSSYMMTYSGQGYLTSDGFIIIAGSNMFEGTSTRRKIFRLQANALNYGAGGFYPVASLGYNSSFPLYTDNSIMNNLVNTTYPITSSSFPIAGGNNFYNRGYFTSVRNTVQENRFQINSFSLNDY